jgi:hypothetical protein
VPEGDRLKPKRSPAGLKTRCGQIMFWPVAENVLHRDQIVEHPGGLGTGLARIEQSSQRGILGSDVQAIT